jgi:PAS domain S-box-containing protein
MAPDRSLVEKVYQAERRIAGFRLLVVLSGFILYPLMDPRGTIPVLAYSLLGGALAYSLWVWRLEPYRRLPLLLSVYVTSFADAGFTMLWLYATGGWESPFYIALYLAIVGVAFRYSLKATAYATVLYTGGYVALTVLDPSYPGAWVDLAIRCVYMVLAAVIGFVVSQEVSEQIRVKTETQQRLHRAQESAAELRAAYERLERSEALLAEAQGLARLGSWQWDIENDVVEWSDELYRIFGLESGKVAATYEGAMQLVHPADRDRLERQVIEASRTGEPFSAEHRIARPDGKTRWIHARGQVQQDSDGRAVRMTGTAQDITDRKQAEEAGERARAQRLELEQLKEMNAFKTMFLNTAAHELGTPLTPIRIQLHTLRDAFPRLEPEQRAAALDLLDRNVERVIRLVDDILDAARLQAGRLDLRPREIRVEPIVDDVVSSFEPQAHERDVRIERRIEPGLKLHADAKRLDQILVNLVSNAIKFTPGGGRVVIEARRSPDGALIRVADTGAGFASDQIRNLFRPFTRLHEATGPSRPGTGLGLYITKGLVELHHGWISAESEGPGKGATFTLHLPRRTRARRGRPMRLRATADDEFLADTPFVPT